MCLFSIRPFEGVCITLPFGHLTGLCLFAIRLFEGVCISLPKGVLIGLCLFAIMPIQEGCISLPKGLLMGLCLFAIRPIEGVCFTLPKSMLSLSLSLGAHSSLYVHIGRSKVFSCCFIDAHRSYSLDSLALLIRTPSRHGALKSDAILEALLIPVPGNISRTFFEFNKPFKNRNGIVIGLNKLFKRCGKGADASHIVHVGTAHRSFYPISCKGKM